MYKYYNSTCISNVLKINFIKNQIHKKRNNVLKFEQLTGYLFQTLHKEIGKEFLQKVEI